MVDHPADSYRERKVCPLYTAIGVVSGRWKPMILRRLGSGPLGFGELQRAMPRVTAKVLREQLRQLQADGLVTRRALTPAHRGVSHQLTPYAKTLIRSSTRCCNGASTISPAPARRAARGSLRRRPPLRPRADSADSLSFERDFIRSATH